MSHRKQPRARFATSRERHAARVGRPGWVGWRYRDRYRLGTGSRALERRAETRASAGWLDSWLDLRSLDPGGVSE